MENLHLKNIKNNNIETIKQTSWFKSFNPEQQYYIKSGLENEINITIFAKKEISGDEMFDILQGLEMQKYNELITLPSPKIYKIKMRFLDHFYTNIKDGRLSYIHLY